MTILFLTFAITLSWTFDDDHNKECQNKCPCLPKCCKKGQVLTNSDKQSINHLNGYECISKPDHNQYPIRPEVKFSEEVKDNSKFGDKESPGFYHSKFPTCGGLGSDWEYQISLDNSLHIHTQDQILTIHDHDQAKVSQVLIFMNLN